MKPFVTRSLLPVLCLLFSLPGFSQNCTSCTQTISRIDNNSYTITEGQMLCITAEGVAKGNITLAGGTLCNEGVINSTNLVLASGTLNNHGVIIIEGNQSIQGTGTVAINNQSSATVNISGNLSLSNGNFTFTSAGTINVKQNVTITAGSFVNNGTFNYNQVSGNYTNNGTVNCCGN